MVALPTKEEVIQFLIGERENAANTDNGDQPKGVGGDASDGQPVVEGPQGQGNTSEPVDATAGNAGNAGITAEAVAKLVAETVDAYMDQVKAGAAASTSGAAPATAASNVNTRKKVLSPQETDKIQREQIAQWDAQWRSENTPNAHMVGV